MTICKEIINGGLHKFPDLFREFSMTIYCFDEPHNPEQSLLIKAIGTTSNELADVVIKMQDHEKLQACRDCVTRAKKLNIQGT